LGLKGEKGVSSRPLMLLLTFLEKWAMIKLGNGMEFHWSLEEVWRYFLPRKVSPACALLMTGVRDMMSIEHYDAIIDFWGGGHDGKIKRVVSSRLGVSRCFCLLSSRG